MIVNGSGQNEQFYREPSIDASYQVLVHLAKWIQRRRFFRNQPIRNKNCLWWPCLLTDWDKMSNLYRGPSIDASYRVSDHLAMWFQRRRFLEIDQSETRIACGGLFVNGSGRNEHFYRGPSIDASYQISDHLAMWFQRRRFLETDQSETRIACGGHVC
jgi:hypothetical protein